MLIDINTCFGSSPTRRVAYAATVAAARQDYREASMPATTQYVDWSLDHLLWLLDLHNIDKAFSYSLRGKLYDFVTGNDETMRVANAHENIVAVATIDPRRYLGCAEEVERCVDMGFRVFRFFPDEQGWSIASLAFLRLCEKLAEHRVSLMMPAANWGRQTEMARLLGQFGFPVIVLGTTFDMIAESIAVAGNNINFYVETSQMHIVGAISGFIREIGAHKLMFGSASPANSFASAHGLIKAADLGEYDDARILSMNACEILLQDGL